jgi:hypothetical protein
MLAVKCLRDDAARYLNLSVTQPDALASRELLSLALHCDRVAANLEARATLQQALEKPAPTPAELKLLADALAAAHPACGNCPLSECFARLHEKAGANP